MSDLDGYSKTTWYMIPDKPIPELQVWFQSDYSPRLSPEEYLRWMNTHLPTFIDNTRNSPNNGFRLGMFTIVSQHVYGNSVEECIDIAIAATNSNPE